MKKIDPKDYVSYTIVGSGWSFTVYTWEKAQKEWDGMRFGTLYGNKPDKTQTVIDNK